MTQVHPFFDRVTLILEPPPRPIVFCVQCGLHLLHDELLYCEGAVCDVRSCHACCREYHITWRPLEAPPTPVHGSTVS